MSRLNHSIKFASISLAALATTCLCFYLMLFLISRELAPEIEIDPIATVSPTVSTREEEKREPVRERPKKVLPLEPPPAPDGHGSSKPVAPRPEADQPVFGNLADLISPDETRLELSAPHSDLAPLYVVQPIYPLSAAMKEVEGFVVVEFSVQENGRVLNPIVVNSEPRVLFDQAALNAVSRFRFKPREVGGDPVRVDNVQLKFSFSLESAYGVEQVTAR